MDGFLYLGGRVEQRQRHLYFMIVFLGFLGLSVCIQISLGTVSELLVLKLAFSLVGVVCAGSTFSFGCSGGLVLTLVICLELQVNFVTIDF